MNKLAGRKIYSRKLRPEDAQDICKNISDKEVVKWLASIPRPYTKTEAKRFLKKVFRKKE